MARKRRVNKITRGSKIAEIKCVRTPVGNYWIRHQEISPVLKNAGDYVNWTMRRKIALFDRKGKVVKIIKILPPSREYLIPKGGR